MPPTINNYAGLADIVRMDVPGADEGAIRIALRESGRSFCLKTEAWREEISIDAVEDETDYDVEFSAGTTIARVIKIEVNGSELSCSSYDFSTSNVLELNTAPLVDESGDGGEIVVMAALIPLLNKDEISDIIVARYGEAIAAGAVARLARSPKKPYSSPDAFALAISIFNDGVTRAKQELVRDRKVPITGWRG